MKDFSHIPVMLNECIEGLNIKNGGIYFDGTVGGAGHSYEILKNSSPDGRLIATDLDEDAISFASAKLAEFEGRFKIYKSNYKDFEEVLNSENIDFLDGALLDFGVSSFQLDCEERGFSYMKPNAPLDMRMDKTAPFTAEKILNEYPQSEIAKILKIYGEEKFANKIADNIVRARTRKPLKTCGELVDIIESSIPAKFKAF